MIDPSSTNQDFYNTVASTWDSTRQAAWPGWEEVASHIESQLNQRRKADLSEPLKLIDIGCGNGRFLSYLHNRLCLEENQSIMSYTGVDISAALLRLAQSRFDAKFVQADVTSVDFRKSLSNTDADTIPLLAILHHLPFDQNLKDLFSALALSLNPHGSLVFTRWNFPKIDSLMRKAVKIREHEYLLTWQDSSSKRFCKFYTDEEIEQIGSILSKHGLKLIESFDSDGRSDDLNSYYIWQNEK